MAKRFIANALSFAPKVLVAAMPLLLLAALAIARISASREFVLCNTVPAPDQRCNSIPDTLTTIFLVEGPTEKPAVKKTAATVNAAGSQQAEPKVSAGKPGDTATQTTKNPDVRNAKETGKQSEQKGVGGGEPAPSGQNNTPDQDPEREKAIKTAELNALKYSGRINWVFLMLVCVGVCFASWCLVLFQIHYPLASKPITGADVPNDSRQPPHRFWWPIWAALMTIGLGIFFYRHPEFHMPLLSKLLPQTLETDVRGIGNVINVVNSMAFASAVLLSTGIVLILRETDRLPMPAKTPSVGTKTESQLTQASGAQSQTVSGQTETGEQHTQTPAQVEFLSWISQAMKRLQRILYASTVLLVVGVLTERSIFQWGLAFISQDKAIQTAAQNLSASILAIDGGFFTLALAVVYLPAAIVLKHKAEHLVTPLEPAEKEKVLQGYGLNFSFTESLPKLVAILAPLLAGPVGELFVRLAK